MSKNLRHLTSIHEAAQELHRRFVGVPWYLRCQVLSSPPESGPVGGLRDKQEIIVYVRTKAALENNLITFNSWPVRYELGV